MLNDNNTWAPNSNGGEGIAQDAPRVQQAGNANSEEQASNIDPALAMEG